MAGWRAPVLNTPAEPTAQPRSKSGLVRRIAISAILSGLVFLVLWIMAFSFVTSVLIGTGFGVVIVVASATSELVETALDAIASIVLAVLAAIAAVIGAVFGLFGN